MEVLSVKNLSKSYGKNNFLALNNVTFNVKKGEFVAIVGKSGSGKSTLLHLLGGLDKPSSGTVLINNNDIFKMTNKKLTVFRRKFIGIVYQFYNLIPVLNIKENILLPALFDGREVDNAKVDGLLKNLGILNKKDSFPNDLSGGEQQRAGIGRALINRPKLLLADEPTGNLDSKNSKQIMKILKFYNKKYKQTIIMVTHDVSLVKQADRVITMSDGKIIKNVVIKH
ncbi:MAG: ABC transporter ATP-binding protein [Bacilli bacterium]|nr:ABC transporter ATP-binding protein [Bacilli bacterium]